MAADSNTHIKQINRVASVERADRKPPGSRSPSQLRGTSAIQFYVWYTGLVHSMARKSPHQSKQQTSLLEPPEAPVAVKAPAKSAHASTSDKTSGKKRLFLVDAMGYIFRAFYAPMDRLENRGMPTKVPYLFSTMMRRLLNHPDRKPDYVAVVFDVSAPTFRDKLFASYKAQRAPMPDELSIQVPFVRRYCEAMQLPIIEMPGYEADDVIASLARQAKLQDLDILHCDQR